MLIKNVQRDWAFAFGNLGVSILRTSIVMPKHLPGRQLRIVNRQAAYLAVPTVWPERRVAQQELAGESFLGNPERTVPAKAPATYTAVPSRPDVTVMKAGVA